jgi:HSP20 family protein
MDEKNIEVTFADGVLTIKGEKQEEREDKKKGYYMRERSSGSFERTFRAPEGIVQEGRACLPKEFRGTQG